MSSERAELTSSMPDFVREIDPCALYFFVTLYRTGSLPRTAEQLGVSISSANRMLARLRAYWDAPLFVRSGASMLPDRSAKEKYEGVVRLLRLLEELRSTGPVDPARLKRTVRLACYDNAFAATIATVHADLAKTFPNVHFQVQQADEHMFDLLRTDKLDLLFFARQGLPPDMCSAAALTTPYACIVAKGHPLTSVARQTGALTRHDVARYAQVLVNAQPDRYRRPNSPGNGYFNPDDPAKISLVTPFFLSVPLCLEGTDHYAIVPEVTARLAFDTSRVDILPLTREAPELTVQLGWHERTQKDPAFELIRSVLLDLIDKSTKSVLSGSRA